MAPQPDAGNPLTLRSAHAGMVPNPRFRHLPAGGEFCGVDKFYAVSRRLGQRNSPWLALFASIYHPMISPVALMP